MRNTASSFIAALLALVGLCDGRPAGGDQYADVECRRLWTSPTRVSSEGVDQHLSFEFPLDVDDWFVILHFRYPVLEIELDSHDEYHKFAYEYGDENRNVIVSPDICCKQARKDELFSAVVRVARGMPPPKILNATLYVATHHGTFLQFNVCDPDAQGQRYDFKNFNNNEEDATVIEDPTSLNDPHEMANVSEIKLINGAKTEQETDTVPDVEDLEMIAGHVSRPDNEQGHVDNMEDRIKTGTRYSSRKGPGNNSGKEHQLMTIVDQASRMHLYSPNVHEEDLMLPSPSEALVGNVTEPGSEIGQLSTTALDSYDSEDEPVLPLPVEPTQEILLNSSFTANSSTVDRPTNKPFVLQNRTVHQKPFQPTKPESGELSGVEAHDGNLPVKADVSSKETPKNKTIENGYEAHNITVTEDEPNVDDMDVKPLFEGYETSNVDEKGNTTVDEFMADAPYAEGGLDLGSGVESGDPALTQDSVRSHKLGGKTEKITKSTENATLDMETGESAFETATKRAAELLPENGDPSFISAEATTDEKLDAETGEKMLPQESEDNFKQANRTFLLDNKQVVGVKNETSVKNATGSKSVHQESIGSDTDSSIETDGVAVADADIQVAGKANSSLKSNLMSSVRSPLNGDMAARRNTTMSLAINLTKKGQKTSSKLIANESYQKDEVPADASYSLTIKKSNVPLKDGSTDDITEDESSVSRDSSLRETDNSKINSSAVPQQGLDFIRKQSSNTTEFDDIYSTRKPENTISQLVNTQPDMSGSRTSPKHPEEAEDEKEKEDDDDDDDDEEREEEKEKEMDASTQDDSSSIPVKMLSMTSSSVKSEAKTEAPKWTNHPQFLHNSEQGDVSDYDLDMLPSDQSQAHQMKPHAASADGTSDERSEGYPDQPNTMATEREHQPTSAIEKPRNTSASWAKPENPLEIKQNFKREGTPPLQPTTSTPNETQASHEHHSNGHTKKSEDEKLMSGIEHEIISHFNDPSGHDQDDERQDPTKVGVENITDEDLAKVEHEIISHFNDPSGYEKDWHQASSEDEEESKKQELVPEKESEVMSNFNHTGGHEEDWLQDESPASGKENMTFPIPTNTTGFDFTRKHDHKMNDKMVKAKGSNDAHGHDDGKMATEAKVPAELSNSDRIKSKNASESVLDTSLSKDQSSHEHQVAIGGTKEPEDHYHHDAVGALGAIAHVGPPTDPSQTDSVISGIFHADADDGLPVVATTFDSHAHSSHEASVISGAEETLHSHRLGKNDTRTSPTGSWGNLNPGEIDKDERPAVMDPSVLPNPTGSHAHHHGFVNHDLDQTSIESGHGAYSGSGGSSSYPSLGGESYSGDEDHTHDSTSQASVDEENRRETEAPYEVQDSHESELSGNFHGVPDEDDEYDDLNDYDDVGTHGSHDAYEPSQFQDDETGQYDDLKDFDVRQDESERQASSHSPSEGSTVQPDDILEDDKEHGAHFDEGKPKSQSHLPPRMGDIESMPKDEGTSTDFPESVLHENTSDSSTTETYFVNVTESAEDKAVTVSAERNGSLPESSSKPAMEEASSESTSPQPTTMKDTDATEVHLDLDDDSMELEQIPAVTHGKEGAKDPEEYYGIVPEQGFLDYEMSPESNQTSDGHHNHNVSSSNPHGHLHENSPTGSHNDATETSLENNHGLPTTEDSHVKAQEDHDHGHDDNNVDHEERFHGSQTTSTVRGITEILPSHINVISGEDKKRKLSKVQGTSGASLAPKMPQFEIYSHTEAAGSRSNSATSVKPGLAAVVSLLSAVYIIASHTLI